VYTRLAFFDPEDASATTNGYQPAAAWCFSFNLYIIFSLCERKNDVQREESTALPKAKTSTA
jgi:hypothetical protein